uniref:hypothetical protein n=1 Tax=Gonatophragmium mori TaxID=2966219 RepID=UPI0023D80921
SACLRKTRFWGKLSNSGEALKIMIPSRIRKDIGGWINYSGKVTSHNMIESEMGNRGSKSVLCTHKNVNYGSNTVKEQRVDDSWHSKKCLRCTLTGFERNYQLKILSKQLTKRFYTTITHINPWFLSGLIDAEGSFSLVMSKNISRKLGWRTDIKFQIGLHIRDLDLLYKIQQYLGRIGSIHIYESTNRVIYSIDSIKDLIKLSIHIDSYPLLTQKYADYLLFKKAIDLISNKSHFTIEGLYKLVNIKASMNKGLSDKLKKEFKEYKPVIRPIININIIPDSYWIAGFVSGEGNFDIRLTKVTTKLGYRVQLRFRITQHIRDIKLMEIIVQKLGCGSVYKYPKQPAVSVVIVNFSDITNILIPFFNEYSILGIKFYDYLDWCKVHDLMINGSHLTPEGIRYIELIKSGMNKGRT